MLVPNRHGSSNSYRYGFNGKEKDDEIKGEGVQYDYGFRIYDPRIGKFLSIDPLFKGFPWFSPYQFAGNTPISCIDLDGLEMYFAPDGSFLGQSKNGGTEIRIATKYTPYKAHKNGKIDEGFRITKSLPLNQFDLETQGKVFQTIYDREVKGTSKVEAYYSDNIDEGAKTKSGKSPIKVNVNFSAVYWDGEKYIGDNGNGDYYNVATNLKHEEYHYKGIGGDGFSHFDIYRFVIDKIKADGSFSKLKEPYKHFLSNGASIYLTQQEYSLSHEDHISDNDFDSYYKSYKLNTEYYNKNNGNGDDRKLKSKKELKEARKYYKNGENTKQ